MSDIDRCRAATKTGRHCYFGAIEVDIPAISGSRAKTMVINPHVARFLTSYPKIKLQFRVDDGFPDIVAAGFEAL